MQPSTVCPNHGDIRQPQGIRCFCCTVSAAVITGDMNKCVQVTYLVSRTPIKFAKSNPGCKGGENVIGYQITLKLKGLCHTIMGYPQFLLNDSHTGLSPGSSFQWAWGWKSKLCCWVAVTKTTPKTFHCLLKINRRHMGRKWDLKPSNGGSKAIKISVE